jgi:two-component system, NtrC family, sensor kinase
VVFSPLRCLVLSVRVAAMKKKRSKASSKPAGARPNKSSKLKSRSRQRPTAKRGAAIGAPDPEVDQLKRDLREALQQQAATSEALRIIASSPSELQPVFDALLANATRLCDASYGTLWLREDDGQMRMAALHGRLPESFRGQWRVGTLFRPSPSVPTARVFHTRKPVQVVDLKVDEAYLARDPLAVASVEVGGIRSLIAIPVLKDGTIVGALTIYRREVRPFTEKHIQLVTNFAAQAVIAIESARLLNELRQRTTGLTESLDQQTATANVLRVISSSSTDIQPALDTIVRTAGELCASEYAALFRLQDGNYYAAAWNNAATEWVNYFSEHPIRVDRGSLVGRTALERSAIHIVDCLADPEYTMHEAARLGRHRSMLGVPLLHHGILIGVIGLLRTAVKPFTGKQIELVTAFADQAVITIENARLLSELRESLQEQTATAEVLQVISSSPGDLQPVFSAMLEKAVRICDAKFGNIYRWDGDALQLVATHNTPPAYAEHRKYSPFRADQSNAVARMIRSKEVVHVFDAAANDTYAQRTDPAVVAAVELGGIRSALVVPMLKEEELIGALIVSRQEVRPFTDKQIALVTNFAAQAVIAIENARLLNELRQRTTDLSESLEKQTATSEVLQVISSSPGDLPPVFDIMLANATRLCEATHGHIWSFDGERLHAVAVRGDEQFVKWLREHNPVRPIAGSAAERIVGGEPFVHLSDRRDEPAYRDDKTFRELVDTSGIRTSLSVALRNGEVLVGMINVYRQDVRPFANEQIDLVKNFATQAVIAIENARLLGELHTRTDQLQVQSEELAKLNQELEQRVSDQVGELERTGRLRRFLPPQVADLIVASGTEKQLESHRREITALFCDLRGFTGFTESADAEDVMALLRDYHAAIGEIIIKYSGTLERYAGDGVMVIFNDPVPVENPALQAVLMALEMRGAIGALTEKWGQLGHEI